MDEERAVKPPRRDHRPIVTMILTASFTALCIGACSVFPAWAGWIFAALLVIATVFVVRTIVRLRRIWRSEQSERTSKE
jgi:hypothetical protein